MTGAFQIVAPPNTDFHQIPHYVRNDVFVDCGARQVPHCVRNDSGGIASEASNPDRVKCHSEHSEESELLRNRQG
jgi:hypothetical protein